MNEFTRSNFRSCIIIKIESFRMSKLSKNNDPTSWWFYFEKIGNNAKCKHCPWEKDRCKNFSTNKLKYHLSTQHPKLFQKKLLAEKEQEEQREKKEAKTKSIQQKLFSAASNQLQEPESSKCGEVRSFLVLVLFSPLLNHYK